MDMKHTRVELLSRIAFQEEWRDAYEIASSVNTHVNTHQKFMKTHRKWMLFELIELLSKT